MRSYLRCSVSFRRMGFLSLRSLSCFAVPALRKRPTSVATAIPSAEPMAKPPSASLNVYQPAGQSVWRAVQNVLTMSLGRGRRNC